jgi:hypothetical protein
MRRQIIYRFKTILVPRARGRNEPSFVINDNEALVPRARGRNGVEFVASSRQKVGNALDMNRKAAQIYDIYNTKKRKLLALIISRRNLAENRA